MTHRLLGALATALVAATTVGTSPAAADDRYADRTARWCGVGSFVVKGHVFRVGVEAHWADTERLSCRQARRLMVRWNRARRNPSGWTCADYPGPRTGPEYPGHGRYRYAWSSCIRHASSQSVVGYDVYAH